jgi:cerevisin
MKGILSVAALPLLAAASPVQIETIHKDAAPILSAENAEVVPNSYLVVFKDGVSHETATAHHEWVQDLHTKTEDKKLELRKRSQIPILDDFFEGLKHTFHIPGSLVGYTGHFDDETIEQVRRHPDVSTYSYLPHALSRFHMLLLHCNWALNTLETLPKK